MLVQNVSYGLNIQPNIYIVLNLTYISMEDDQLLLPLLKAKICPSVSVSLIV